MSSIRTRRLAIIAALIGATSGGAAFAATAVADSAPAAPARIQQHWTPNQCIQMNGGDYTACNVGNSGRGDLPYSVMP